MSFFTYVGIVVVVCVGCGTTAVGGFLGAIWLWGFVPRIHFGAPANPLEFRVYDRRQIVSTKVQGDASTRSSEPRIIRSLGIHWWIGFGCRRKSKWFLGFMRWSEK